MKNYLQDAIAFLQGEADQLSEYKNSEGQLADYIYRNGLSEEYDLRVYLDNTWMFIVDQVSVVRGYDKQFATHVLDIIDAYYAGGSTYAENDIEAECELLVDALNYTIKKLEEGELNNE